jgi:hypothetical protein
MVPSIFSYFLLANTVIHQKAKDLNTQSHLSTMIPKRTGINLLPLLRRPATRCLSTTTAARANPQRYGPNDPRGGSPVDDIDVVFDFPSEGQASYQKRTLEESGLDIHSAMPHHTASKFPANMKTGGKTMAGGEGGNAPMYVLFNQVLSPYGYV